MAKSSSNRIWWIIGGIIVVLLAGLMVAKSAGWIGKPKATEVTFAKVGSTDITERVSASGKVQPEVEIKITPDVPGEIIGLYVAEGDSVTEGQLLLKIRPDNYESVLARARANVNQTKAGYEQSRSAQAQTDARLVRATADYNRSKKLYADKVISDSDFETAEANYRVARQDLESAKANVEAARFNVQSSEAGLREANENLRKTTIYAPSSGTISKLAVELGERVVGTSQMAGTELLRIANLNNMEVRVNVNENDIVRVSLGDSVVIDVDAYTYSGRKFKGIVTEMANTANGSGSLSAAASSTDAVTEFEVKIRVLRQSYRDLIDRKNKKSFPFRPGMTASVEVITDRKPGVLSVPIAAVTTRGDQTNAPADGETPPGDDAQTTNTNTPKPRSADKPQEVVFVHKGDKVEMRKVKTGISDFENIEVTEGLKAGEEIVSGPFLVVSKRLKDGELVMLKKVDKNAKEKASGGPPQ
ncbi:MAG: efflux RND transporter periplasmic adaptor subunit [Cytophagaceae bacterium]|nr:efflux RND transporter periplasmic adaptor subunit [Cytophagaceae bacterium]